MLPNINFNPSFANLAALHGLGGMPHPIKPVAPIRWGEPMPDAPMPMPGSSPVYSGVPAQTTMPMQMPQGNLSNLRALMQILGRQNV